MYKMILLKSKTDQWSVTTDRKKNGPKKTVHKTCVWKQSPYSINYFQKKKIFPLFNKHY